MAPTGKAVVESGACPLATAAVPSEVAPLKNCTLPVALASLSREHVQDSELMMAGAVLTVLPVLFLFLVLQRYYLRGMMTGAVKG